MQLMTKSSEVRERVLSAIGTGWRDREDLAEQMGKNQLNPSDLKHLRQLLEDKVIERKTETVGITPKYYYRLTQ